MGLFSKQFSNVVEWEEYRDDLLFWKWDNKEMENLKVYLPMKEVMILNLKLFLSYLH